MRRVLHGCELRRCLLLLRLAGCCAAGREPLAGLLALLLLSLLLLRLLLLMPLPMLLMEVLQLLLQEDLVVMLQLVQVVHWVQLHATNTINMVLGIPLCWLLLRNLHQQLLRGRWGSCCRCSRGAGPRPMATGIRGGSLMGRAGCPVMTLVRAGSPDGPPAWHSSTDVSIAHATAHGRVSPPKRVCHWWGLIRTCWLDGSMLNSYSDTDGVLS